MNFRPRHPIVALMLWACGVSASAQSVTAPSPYDGRWTVILTCEDTQDRNGMVKGYEFTFDARIVNGRLDAQYGSPGHPSSVTYTGTVAADGALEIRASGQTGKSEYAVGRLAQGSSYQYTMSGRLEGSTGRAVRRELRPCVAVFTRP